VLPELLSAEQLRALSNRHVLGFSRSAARAAVLSEVEPLQLDDYLCNMQVDTVDALDRRRDLRPRLAELDKAKLLTFLDARGAAAVLRFASHYQAAP